MTDIRTGDTIGTVISIKYEDEFILEHYYEGGPNTVGGFVADTLAGKSTIERTAPILEIKITPEVKYEDYFQ